MNKKRKIALWLIIIAAFLGGASFKFGLPTIIAATVCVVGGLLFWTRARGQEFVERIKEI